MSIGCFFGGDDGDDPEAVAPGYYVADYAGIDSTTEAEFHLDSSGFFRFIVIEDNVATVLRRGEWKQAGTDLHFLRLEESKSDVGLHSMFNFVEDDTNAVRAITDTGFTRKEWTVFRQKPYWIAYAKAVARPMAEGVYEHLTENRDSTTTFFRLTVQRDAFAVSAFIDSQEVFQAEADWYLDGTFFVNRKYRSRLWDDSTRQFSPWDSVVGDVFRRVREVSDSGFQLWRRPVSFLDPGEWQFYRKVE